MRHASLIPVVSRDRIRARPGQPEPDSIGTPEVLLMSL